MSTSTVASIPREVLQWLGGLNLSSPLRDVPRNVSNGLLVAEVCSRYFPRNAAAMGYFPDVSARHLKLENWNRLLKFLVEHDINLPKENIEAAVADDHSAVVVVLAVLHAALTGRQMSANGQRSRAQMEDCALTRKHPLLSCRLLNAHGNLASKSDADIRGDDGFELASPNLPDQQQMMSSSRATLGATGIRLPLRFDAHVRCHASLGGCEQQRLPRMEPMKSRTASDKESGIQKFVTTIRAPSNSDQVDAVQFLRAASFSALQQQPLATSSRRAWRSTAHSERLALRALPGGDSARYPWIGGNPWHVKR